MKINKSPSNKPILKVNKKLLNMIHQPLLPVLLDVEENSILTASPNIKPFVTKYSKKKENNSILNNKEFSINNIKKLSKMSSHKKKEMLPTIKRIKNQEQMIKK